MLLLLIINLFTYRLVLQLLGITDYGVYQIVGGIVLIFSIINNALAAGSSRFITFALGKGDRDNLKKTFNASFEIHLFLSLVIFILAETVGLWYVNTYLIIPADRIVAAQWVYQFSIISGVLSLSQVPYSATIIAHERMDIYAYVGIAEGIFKLALVTLLFLCNNVDKLILYGLLQCMWNIALQCYYRIFCFKNFPESHLSFIKDKEYFKEMIKFSFWDVIGIFASNGTAQGVNLLINMFFGIIYNASFGLCNQVNGILNQFMNQFMVAACPQITKDYAQRKLEKMHSLVLNTSKMGSVLYLFVALPMFMETDYILSLWLKKVPDMLAIFLKLAIIICYIRSFARPVITSVHASGNIKYLNIYAGGLSAFLTIPLTYIVYKAGGAITSTYYISIFIAFICNYSELYVLHQQINIFSIKDYSFRVYLPCSIVAIIAFVIQVIIAHVLPESIFRLLIVCITSTLSLALGTYYFILNKEQRFKVLLKTKEKLSSISR